MCDLRFDFRGQMARRRSQCSSRSRWWQELGGLLGWTAPRRDRGSSAFANGGTMRATCLSILVCSIALTSAQAAAQDAQSELSAPQDEAPPPVDPAEQAPAVQAEPVMPAPPVTYGPAEAPPPPPEPVVSAEHHRPTRVFGLGTSHGAGVAAASISDFSGGSTLALGFALLLPSLEAQIFLGSDDISLEVSVPVLNIAIVSAVTSWFVWNTNVYLAFHFGDDVRFVVGPGLGFSVVSAGSLGGFSLRIPAVIGVEFLTPASSFGARLQTRPFVELAFVSGGTQVGGGALLELAFHFYVHEDRSEN